VSPTSTDTVVVTFDQSIPGAIGNWTIEVDDGGGFAGADSVAFIDGFNLAFHFPSGANSGDPWQVLTDNGDLLWSAPPLLGLPYTGGTL
jgi:hypothetical protein